MLYYVITIMMSSDSYCLPAHVNRFCVINNIDLLLHFPIKIIFQYTYGSSKFTLRVLPLTNQD